MLGETEVGSLAYYNELFIRVLADPEAFSEDRAAWRLASSFGRCDVVRALLLASPKSTCLEHGLKWAAPEAEALLRAHKEALMLANFEYDEPPAEACPRRI